MDSDLIGQIIVNGVMLSSLYVLIALGLTLVFGVMRVINFAHGELYMLGAYMVWWLYSLNHLNYVLVVLLAAVVVGVLGIGLERVVFRPLRATPMMGLLASVGVSLALQITMLAAFGKVMKPVALPFTHLVNIFGFNVAVHRLIIAAVGIGLVILLGLFLQRTKQGLAILACAEDSQAAALQGISLNRSAAITMGLGAALAAIAGALAAPTILVNPMMGRLIILKVFMIVIIGGAGSMRGVVLIGFLLGMLESLTATIFDPMLATPVELGILMLVLVLRPKGLFAND